jgi:CRP/FNR family transcriptional regulator
VHATPDVERPSARLARLIPSAAYLPPGLARDVDARAIGVKRGSGTVLFEYGNACPGLLVLERGAVRVSRMGPGGRELLLYRVRPGETCVLTLSCLLGHETYPARGVAEEDIDGLLLPSDLFERLTADVSAFRSFAFSSFAGRIAQVLDLAAAVAFERLDHRIAAALLERVAASGRVEIEVTHAALAAELGTVRERVSRVLETFASRGAVELGRGRVRVRDKAALEAIVRRH